MFPIQALKMRNPAPAGYRYWWLAITANNGDASFTQIQEIEFLDAGGNVISTSGGTAFEGGNGSVADAASRAFDGNSANSWARTGLTDIWVGMDFGAGNLKNVAKVRITSASGAGVVDRPPKTWSLRYSNSAVSSISDGTALFSANSNYWVSEEVRTFPESLTYPRVWALFTLTVNGGAFTFTNEIAFNDTPGGTDQTPALTTNAGGTTGRCIGRSITNGSEEGYRTFDNSTLGSSYSSDYGAVGASYIGFAKPGGYPCGEVVLTAGQYTTWSPRNTQLKYWDEGTGAWVQQGSDYDWGNWTTLATRTHVY